MKDNWGSNLVCFLLGAATGAAIALLYAPKEGEATRRYLGEKAGDLRDKASEVTTNVAQTAREKIGQVTEKAQDLLHQGQSAARDGVDKAADQVRSVANS